jgi:hypothetical protein
LLTAPAYDMTWISQKETEVVTENVKSTKSYKTFCLSSRMILRMRCAFLRACVWPERDSHDRAKTNVGLLACFACRTIFHLRSSRGTCVYTAVPYVYTARSFLYKKVFWSRRFLLWTLVFDAYTNSCCDDVPVILKTEFGSDELEGGWPS